MQASGGPVSQQHSRNQLDTVQPERRLQDGETSCLLVADPAGTPVPRRERPRRSSERQRGSAASTLAASVGLQCPGGGAEWRASERLSQVNLDAIVFPGDLQAAASGEVTAAGPGEPPETDGNGPEWGRSTPSPPAPQRKPSSLRISESSLASCSDQQQLDADASQDDCDEVFVRNLPCPSPPQSPLQDTSSVEDFPPPPTPPPDVDQAAEDQTGGRSSPLPPPPSSPSSSLHSPPGPSLPADLKPQPPSGACEPTPTLALEYQPLPRREKTCEDLQVEALAKQLVSQDSSLAPLLDMFGLKSTVELMEEVFTPNSHLGGKSPWQRRGSRTQDGLFDPPPTDAQKDPDQTPDLNTTKVELCEALRSSVAALQQEREALREEQRHHRALGASVESLVQERLKANEKDKYSMFVGDLEKIVNLLLSLCSRLMRIDRSLLALERDQLVQEDAAEERDSLLHKRSMVLRQADDAQELKENLERRQRVVHGILSGYLTQPQLQDYRSFVGAKPALLIRQRHLDNLIRQREEQLAQLADSLPGELADAHGGSGGRPIPLPSPAPCPFSPPSIPGSAHPVRPTAVTSL